MHSRAASERLCLTVVSLPRVLLHADLSLHSTGCKEAELSDNPCVYSSLSLQLPGPTGLWAWADVKLRWMVVSPSDHVLCQTWLTSPSLSRKLREKRKKSGPTSPSLLSQARTTPAVPAWCP